MRSGAAYPMLGGGNAKSDRGCGATATFDRALKKSELFTVL